MWSPRRKIHGGLPARATQQCVDASKLLSTNICQQSVFYRRDLFDDYGPFRREYRVCADWDMALRVLGAEQAQWIDVVVAEYAATGMSSRTTDHRFRRDRPLLVAKMVLKRPLDDRFFNARYGLATFARARRYAMGIGEWTRHCSGARPSGWLPSALCVWQQATPDCVSVGQQPLPGQVCAIRWGCA